MVKTFKGTSLCKESGCITCISKLSCSLECLLNDIIVVSKILNTPIEELFPSLEFHKSIINGK